MEEHQDRSLRGRVFEKLREDILSGVYKDCDELREITIGEEMGVSRTRSVRHLGNWNWKDL